MSPSVEKLAIHLPNEHYVVYDPDKTKTSSELRHMMESRDKTTLTAFFELNRTDPNARQYLYTEILRHYRWVKSSKKKEEVKTFQKRKRRSGQGESLGEGESTQIGRIPVIVPGRPDRDELFYLRLLLHNVPGPTSWDFLKTVEERIQLDDGSWDTQTTVCDTFYQACVLRGLCEGMNDAKEALREAMTIKFGSLLRHFFVTLVANGMAGDAPALFEEFKDDLCEDRESRPLDARATPAMINKALVEMKGMFADLGVDWGKTKLPEPDVASFDVGDFLSRELQEEANRRIDLSNQNTDEKIQMMNSGQRKLLEEVIHSVKEKQGRLFAVDAPGGTGKTFTVSTLLDKVRKDGYIAVATAFTGIAAILLPGLGTNTFISFFVVKRPVR